MAIERESTGLLIAVIGDENSGKDHFIAAASGAKFADEPYEEYEFTLPVGSVPVTLMDTPNFGKPSTIREALRQTKEYVSQRFADSRRLDGVIYVHSIAKSGKDFLPSENFPTLEELCGSTTLEDLLIVTTMWNGNTTAMNESRERSLRTHDRYFGHAVHKRAQMHQFQDTKSSAHDILNQFSHKFDAVRSRIVRLKVPRPLPLPKAVETPPRPTRDTLDLSGHSPISSRSRTTSSSQESAELLKALGTMHQQTTDDLKKKLEEEKAAHWTTQGELAREIAERVALSTRLEQEKATGEARCSAILCDRENAEKERDDWKRKCEEVEGLRSRGVSDMEAKARQTQAEIDGLRLELHNAKASAEQAAKEAKEAVTRAENAEKEREAQLSIAQVQPRDDDSSTTRAEKTRDSGEVAIQTLEMKQTKEEPVSESGTEVATQEGGRGGEKSAKQKRSWWKKLLTNASCGCL